MSEVNLLDYRTARAADGQLWSDFISEQQRITYDFAPDFSQRRRAERVQYAQELLADPDYHCLLAFEEGGLVGMTAIRRGPARWEREADLLPNPTEYCLDKLYLVPAWHGTGLARELFDRVLADVFGDAAKSPELYLWLVDGNDRAARFYEKLGFRHLDEVYDCGPDWQGKTMHRMIRP